ncbi:hypothetical protein [uncultured Thiodictyon sp.]|uniref:hypothetical protein n=1 Tax=uncultured Thiodictyon sp. TaxID=1846217 RepID=UPI0025FD1BB4|nr:hypothetical protein [uncultured Thiodictyon sp.]
MTPAFKDLEELLRSTCRSGDPNLAAYGENYLFEERVSGPRQGAYESAQQGNSADFAAWDRWHRDQYLPRAIHRAVPETFTGINAEAAHSSALGEDQWLVRVENLRYALGENGLTIDRLHELLTAVQDGRRDPKYDLLDAEASLEGVCESLNRNPYAVRPRFAGFYQGLEDTLAAPDWPDLVRDRFGLAHFNPAPKEIIPVALMRYPVRDVLAAARKAADAVHPICVPTVLDHEFTSYFVPAPRQLPYGRTLQLAGDPDCEYKIAEVLHLRLAYRVEHLFRVGVVTRPVDTLVTPGLARLRADHIFCLQYESDRNDFGALPPGWSKP